MIIGNAERSISFEITGYQFPNYQPEDGKYDFDANWLEVTIIYTENGKEHKHRNACILTDEMERMIRGVSEVIDNKRPLYISSFLEPYIGLTIMRVNDFIVIGLEYVYSTSGDVWKRRGATQQITEDQAAEVFSELKEMNKRYPKR